MFSYETKNKLCDLLLAISEGERQIEIVRQILAEQKEFEPYAAFRRIDRDYKLAITCFDIQNFLDDNGVHHSERYIQAFINKYDGNRDGVLNYSEFLVAVLPMDNPLLRTIATQRPNYDVAPDEFLPYDVEYALVKVLDREVSFYTTLDYPKYSLLNRYDYNNVDAFNAIDRFHSGRIDFDNLKAFFRNQALFPYDEELIAILRRMDKDDDGLVKYEEFADAMEAVDPAIKSSVKPSPKKYSSPLKRSSIRKIARSDKPLEKSFSPLKKTTPSALKKSITTPYIKGSTSPFKKATSPLKSSHYSPARKVASPLRNSMTISPSRRFTTTSPLARSLAEDKIKLSSTSPTRMPMPLDASLSKPLSNSRYQSPLKKKLEEETYTQKLLKSIESKSPLRKSVSTLRKSLSPEKRAKSPIRDLTASTTKLRKPLNLDENSESEALISTLKQLIVLDKDLELGKQDLALRPDFNLLDLFRVFDIDAKGSLTTGEVETGMKQFAVYPSREELYLLCRRFDRDTDGKLRFSDFADAFTPKQSEYSSLLNNRSPMSGDIDTPVIELFSMETKKHISKVLKLHLENESSTETLRQRLNKRALFSIHDAFNHLDVNEDGYITAEELKIVLEKHDSYATEKEIRFLMDRFDLNKDAKISYSEFVQEITPKSDKKY